MKFIDRIIQYGTLLFVLLIPWQARWILVEGKMNNGYWEYGTQSLYATELVLLVIMIALLIKGAIHLKQRKTHFSGKRLTTPAFALFLLVTWAGLSVFWSANALVALEHWTVLVEMAIVALLVAYAPIRFSHIGWAIIASAALQSLLAVAQVRMQWIPGASFFGMAEQHAHVLGASVVETANGRWLRAYGSFPHPNILASWLVLGLVLLFERWPRFLKQDIAVYALFVIILFGLLATYSRSGWIAFAIALLFGTVMIYLRGGSRTRALKLVTLAVLAAGFFTALYPDVVSTRIYGDQRLEAQSNGARIIALEESARIITSSPVIGVGLGSYTIVVHDLIDESRQSFLYQPVHAAPILIIAEIGIVGFLIALYVGWIIVAGKPREQPLVEAGILMYPLLTLILFDHYMWTLYPGMMILGVYLGLELKRKRVYISTK